MVIPVTNPHSPLLSPTDDLVSALHKIADALNRIAPKPTEKPDFSSPWMMWDADRHRLRPCPPPRITPLALLHGIEDQKQTLYDNTRRFIEGYPANHALLWGARGMGKSSVVKSIHHALLTQNQHGQILIDLPRAALSTLPDLLNILAETSKPVILFCDDFSFSAEENGYKTLKSILEGGLGTPENILFYATSNRRHLMPRQMIDNEQTTAIHPNEAIEEYVSLSDRFGLWLGFYPCDENTYQGMVTDYARAVGLTTPPAQLQAEAFEWALTRGARSGRVAWQFIRDRMGQEKIKIPQHFPGQDSL